MLEVRLGVLVEARTEVRELDGEWRRQGGPSLEGCSRSGACTAEQGQRTNHARYFCQEVYDDEGKLVESHEKLPVDRGHQKE